MHVTKRCMSKLKKTLVHWVINDAKSYWIAMCECLKSLCEMLLILKAGLSFTGKIC